MRGGGEPEELELGGALPAAKPRPRHHHRLPPDTHSLSQLPRPQQQPERAHSEGGGGGERREGGEGG
eukprot:2444241-Rhodomonas_salina.1